MPFNHASAHRHLIPRARYRVTNWRLYEAGLRRLGDLTLWPDAEALAGWAAPKRRALRGQRVSRSRHRTRADASPRVPPRAASSQGARPERVEATRARVARAGPIDVEPARTNVAGRQPRCRTSNVSRRIFTNRCTVRQVVRREAVRTQAPQSCHCSDRCQRRLQLQPAQLLIAHNVQHRRSHDRLGPGIAAPVRGPGWDAR